MSRLFSFTVILGYFNSRLFTFPPFKIFKNYYFCDIGIWFAPFPEVLGFFVFFIHKEAELWELFALPLLLYLTTCKWLPLRVGDEGRTNSLYLLGLLNFGNSVLLFSDPGMFEQPGKERWAPTGTAGVFLQHTQDPDMRRCRLAPSLLCLPCWRGDWEAPVDWHF